MSGGFFRGTSADQDTRFSNKQAKLLKSQKFPSELEHLVDITKVKMDVMKPWIAQRVTELLGFEDEVLINFIYGLLEGKAVNGKEVQISLTGFMEKNTGKFMKELWQLLLSAQNNASGVPQQFLDAKEDETRKKQAESDMIKSEMQKKKEKEGRDMEEEKLKKLDGMAGMRRTDAATLEPNSKRHPEDLDDKEMSARNGARGRNRVSKSPRSPGGVSLSPRNRRSKSMSKSFSNSRSYSEERHKSRGLTRSPTSRRRSSSSELVHRSRPKRSITPRRKYSPSRSISPSIRKSSHSRRRSTSRSRRTSPSPVRRRMVSPVKYTRPRSPIRRRSRTPVRRRSRSPPRYRSRSPVRRRYASPLRRRSPSPVRRRYRRSPSSPPHRSSLRRRSPSPIRNRRRSPTPPRYRHRPQEASSASPVRRLSPSPVMKRSRQRSPVRSPRDRTRAFEKSSPDRYARHKGSSEDSDDTRDGPGSGVQRPSVSLRSPQRDTRVSAASSSPSPSPKKTQIHSKSPTNSRRRSPSEDRRSNSPYKSRSMQSKEHKVRDVSASPPQNPRDPKPHQESPDAITKKGEFDPVRTNGNRKFEPSERSTTSSKPDVHKDMARVGSKHEYSPERSAGRHSSDTRNRSDDLELRKKEPENRSGKTSTKVLHPEDSVKEKGPATYKGSQKDDEKIRLVSDEAKHIKRLHETDKETVKVDEKGGRGSVSSGSDDSLELRNRKGHEHRKHKRSGKKEATSDDSSDSEIEDRKEAKRRKKEEKRSRKEERRRRREERHKRREERRAEKLKAKSNEDSSAEETVSDPKKLEIELREKALESLRAKKGVGN